MFTIVTFPFFFGMMFGDMGHGSILFFFGLFLIIRYDSLKENKVWAAIGQLRYLFTLMGFMAFYAGSIYNEFFALGVNMWGSCYDMNNIKETGTAGLYRFDRREGSCTFPWGMDPGWSVADSNELLFVNSVKMKMAVIFGVLHMSFGVFHKGANTLYNRDYLSFFTEVIAGILILWGLFGWMDMLILTKFFKTYDIDAPGGEIMNQGVDGIINIMVTTVFKFGGYDKPMQAIIGSS